jgi:integrase
VLLTGPSKTKDTHHQPALQRDDAQRWWKELLLRDGMGTKALQFLTLVASRSGEVRGMTWSEIHPLNGDKSKPIWIIPAERMKAKREHRTPLTPMMTSILESIPRHPSTDLIFHSEKGKTLSDMTLSAAMKRIHEGDIKDGGSGFIDISSKKIAVPHGLRSTFRNWAAENDQDSDMAEIQLAHYIGDNTFRAYHRTDLIEKRRKMLIAWGDFLVGSKA